MKLHLLALALASVVSAASAFGQANTPAALPGAPAVASTSALHVLAPAKGYIKTDEPLVIRFLEGKGEDARKAFDAIGHKATRIPGSFAPAAAGDVVDASGNPQFALYTFADKKPVARKADAKVDASKGELDLLALFPDIAKSSGTYVLTWKNATPLVVEVLGSPLQWGLMIASDPRLTHEMRAAKVKEARAEPPTVIHVLPLECGLIKTDQGEIKALFYYDVAPHTVDNWIRLAREGYYDGSAFHRILKGFMIQGGDALANTDRAGSGGPGYQIGAEFSERPHERGVLSMARSGWPDSAGSQFFIMHGRAAHLDWDYTAFGQVIEGLDVVDKIASTPADGKSGAVKGARPKIESVRIVPATADMYGIKK